MKRWHMVCLALFLFLGLTACRGSEKVEAALYNQDSKVTISLGMSQEEVAGLLGEGKYLETPQLEIEGYKLIAQGDEIARYTYGKGKDSLMVTYKDHLVDGIATAIVYANIVEGSSNWCDKYKITNGSSREDMFEHYGEKEAVFPGTLDNEDYYVFEYYFDETGKQISDMSQGYSYSYQFSLDNKSGKILGISICYSTKENSSSPSNTDTGSQ